MLPDAAATLDEAHAAIELWEFYSGKKLDPTQRLVVEVMMACREDGTWAARTTGREMPRQNGKGDEIEVPEFWGLVKLHEAILHTVHDAVLLATQAQERMLSLFQHRDLRHLIEGGQVWKGTGQQMIKLSTGGQIWYRTRTGGGGRGVDKIDRLVVDEAQHATGEQLRSVSSTLMAAPDPQMNAMGTAALDGKSAWWWNIRRRALTKEPGPFGYVGHTAEKVWLDDEGKVHQEGPDIEDREVWRSVNPAVAAGRGQGMAFLEEELWNLGHEGFAQEHLGVWAPEPLLVGGGPIDLRRWSALAAEGGLIDPDSTPDPARSRIALDTNPERTWFTLCLAGHRHDGLIHGETTKSHNDKSQAVALAVDAAAKLGVPVTCSDAALAADIESAGGSADLMKTAEQAAATAALIDATRGEAPLLRHRGEPALRRALELAQTKPYSDGGITWSRRSTSGDISPLTALTMAFGRLTTAEPEEEFFIY